MSQIVRTSLVSSVVQSGITVAAVTLPLTLIAQESYPSYASGYQNHAEYVQEARARYTNPYVPAGRGRTGGTFRLAPGEALATSGEYVKQFFGDVVGKAKSLTQRRPSAPAVYSQPHVAASANTPKRSSGFSPRSLLPSFGSPPRGAVENPTGHGRLQSNSPALAQRQLTNPDAPNGGGRVALQNYSGSLPEPLVRNQGRRSQTVWAPENTVTKRQAPTSQSSTTIPRLPIEAVAPIGQPPAPAQNLPVPPEPVSMENPQAGPRPTLEQTAPKHGYLVGTDSGKPGRVLSPYPPHQELDVTGIASGDLAIDPIANKIFRIP